MYRSWKSFSLIITQILIIALLSGCSSTLSEPGGVGTSSGSIVFADAEWESIKLHNRIAGYIIEHGYGYNPSYLNGENLPLFKALRQGDVDIMMEVWTSDYSELWAQMLKSGKVNEVGTNYIGIQGWFIPAYLVQGDAERGIEPEIPGFKSVLDLPAYQQYFKLSATSNKGIIYNAPHGWTATAINTEKFNNYYLEDTFSLLPSESEASLAGSLDQAYKRGDSWLGYARVPSLIAAGHKLLLVREEPFTDERWRLDRGCSYPNTDVMIAVNSSMRQKAPEVLDFLHNYQTTTSENEEMLLYLIRFEGNEQQAAEEWLLSNPDVWSQWVPEEVAEKIWTVLNQPLRQK